MYQEKMSELNEEALMIAQGTCSMQLAFILD